MRYLDDEAPGYEDFRWKNHSDCVPGKNGWALRAGTVPYRRVAEDAKWLETRKNLSA